MRKLALIMSLFLCLGLEAVFAQTKNITGVVTGSEDGQPIPGVSVSVKGSSLGTVTSIDGTYSLAVSADASAIVFRFVGMKTQEIVFTGQSKINVVMEAEAFNVDEVVVTALGIKKEAKALGYAVQEVKSEDLSKTGSSDLSKALQGKLAGVDIKVSSGMPGASSQIVIRGARSFTGNNTPLYVVDGMPIESTSYYSTGDGVTGADIANRAVDINPNDIESINVLKGQAAAALYGLRASNGVIIITTKSGKGGPKGKTVVTLSQNTSFDVVSRTPDYQTTWSQGFGGSYDNGSSSSWGEKISDLANNATFGGNTNNKYTQADGLHNGQYYVAQRAKAGLDPWATPKVHNNWNDYFQTGVTSTTGVNLSKATDEGSYILGIGYTDQDGIALNTGMKRWNVKGSSERKLNDHFTSGFSGNYSNTSIDKLSGANDGSLAGILAAPSSYDLKGIPSHVPGDPYTQVYYRSLTFDNPYWVDDNNTFNEQTSRFFGNGHIDYNVNFAEDMKLLVKYQLGVDTYASSFQDIFGYGSKGKTGTIDNYGVTQTTTNSLLTANYDWKMSTDFSFNALIGNEYNHTNTKDYEEYGEGFNFGGWNHISNAKTVTAYEHQYQDRTVGFFYSASLEWKNMVYLNTTGRNDITSSMPTNNRSFFYPSVSLGVVLSELSALKQMSWLNFAKVRGSYAEVGQAGTYKDNYYTTPSYGGSWWNGVPISYPMGGVSAYTPSTTLYDPNLKPQNTKSYEVGVNIKMFNNRIGIDYTYSRQNVVDQIFDVPLAASTGAETLKMNGGKLHTTMNEVVLTLVPIKTTNFVWDLSFNYSKMENIVDELADGVESIFLGGFTTPQVRAGIGYAYPVIYGTQYKRNSNGQILVDEDPTSKYYGMPMAGDDGIIGKVSPDFILGWSTNFTYKNVSLGAVFEWKNGGQMYSGSNGLLDLYGMSKKTEDRESTFIYKGYKADGTPNDIVRGGSNDPLAYQYLYNSIEGNIDESYIKGNSFVKLRELSLKYQLPKKLIPSIDLAITAYSRNILLWTELDNVDPESSQGNTNMMGSFERFSMPQTTSYGFGVEVKF